MKYLLFLTFFFTLAAAQAQNKNSEALVQFSGVVVSSDSLQPIPFTSIIIRNTYRGTVSDVYGFFSFVARMKDTIEFSAIGFKKGFYIIPDTITNQRYSLIQMLTADTIMLRETVIYPWPTKEQFKEAFLNLHIPDDDLARAERNLNRDQLNAIADGMTMDGSMNYKYQMNQHASRLYYAGQVPTSNWLNPIAWAKFIESWQSGQFKKK
jgi:hypothetical protein